MTGYINISLYERARDLFVRLLLDGADLIAAQEARESFIRTHHECWDCKVVKHKSAFGTYGLQVYCKACQSIRQSERWARRKLVTIGDAEVRPE